MHSLIAGKLSEIEHLCRRHHVERLDLFGSATGERFDPESSDVDFLVRFLPLEGRAYPDAFFGLLQDLECLLGRPVDLVSAPRIENPYLRRSIEQSRETLFVA